MSVEQILNSAPDTAETATLEPVQVEEVALETQEAPEVEAKEPEPEEIPFPKKALKALSRRDRQIGKLRAELQQREAELQRFQQAPTSPQTKGPQEEQFDNYGDYLKAVGRFEAQQEREAETSQKQKEQSTQAQEAWVAEREAYVSEKAQEAIKSVPDFQNLLMEHSDVVNEFPPYLQTAFYELDNAPMAFYALAKEGKLEGLLTMSPGRAIMEIGKAEERGIAMARNKPVTRAPAPLSANKGTASGYPRLEAMSGDEILKAIRKG